MIVVGLVKVVVDESVLVDVVNTVDVEVAWRMVRIEVRNFEQYRVTYGQRLWSLNAGASRREDGAQSWVNSLCESGESSRLSLGFYVGGEAVYIGSTSCAMVNSDFHKSHMYSPTFHPWV